MDGGSNATSSSSAKRSRHEADAQDASSPTGAGSQSVEKKPKRTSAPAAPPQAPSPFPLRDLPLDALGLISTFLCLGERDLAALCLVLGRKATAAIKHRHLRNNAGALAYLTRLKRLDEWTDVNADWRDMMKPYYVNADHPDLKPSRPVQFDVDFAPSAAAVEAVFESWNSYASTGGTTREVVEYFLFQKGGVAGGGQSGAAFCINWMLYCREMKLVTTAVPDIPEYVVVVAIDGQDVTALPFADVKEILCSRNGCSKKLRVTDSLFAQKFMCPIHAIENGRLSVLRYHMSEVPIDIGEPIIPLGSAARNRRDKPTSSMGRNVLYDAAKASSKCTDASAFEEVLSHPAIMPGKPVEYYLCIETTVWKAQTTALHILADNDCKCCSSRGCTIRAGMVLEHPRYETEEINSLYGTEEHGTCTPLHAAALNLNRNMVKLLLEAGANPFIGFPLAALRATYGKANEETEDAVIEAQEVIELLEEAHRTFEGNY